MSNTTFTRFFVESYRPLRLLAASDATLENYEMTFRVMETWRSGLCVESISESQIAEFLGYCLSVRGNAPATANKNRRNICAVLNLAAELGIRSTPPKIPKIREVKRQNRAWLPVEIDAMLTVACSQLGHVGKCHAADWWPALILTSYSTGVRISALMALRCDDIDFDRRVVRFRGETQKHRSDQSFRVSSTVMDAVRKIRAQERRLARLFDDWPHDRNRRQWPTLNRYLRRILDGAGLPTTRRDMWHKQRRTFATQITKKMGRGMAQEMLGHSSMAITQAYIDNEQIGAHEVDGLIDDPVLTMAG